MAYYHVDMACLFVMLDVAETEDFGMLRRGTLPGTSYLPTVPINTHKFVIQC